jgi:hypothetical protein
MGSGGVSMGSTLGVGLQKARDEMRDGLKSQLSDIDTNEWHGGSP